VLGGQDMLHAIAPSLNIKQIRQFVLNFKPASNGLEQPAPPSVIASLDKLCTEVSSQVLNLELAEEQLQAFDLSFIEQPLKNCL